MTLRLLPKLLLWAMLTVSCIGAVGTLLRTGSEPAPARVERLTEQQMAIETAVGFAREWMHWDGQELAEARAKRLQPYVNPELLSSMAVLKTEKKTMRQQVVAAEFVSLAANNGSRYVVRVRVTAENPERITWVIEVPVWVQLSKGAAVTGLPVIRPGQDPPTVPPSESDGSKVSAEMKQRMRTAIESFLKVMLEGEKEEILSNYVTGDSHLIPLAGRLHFVSLDQLAAEGVGPFTASVSFTVKDTATGFQFAQRWKLSLVEENGKFFVRALSV
ncbi:conjugal transfer protein [Cohnella zeiphila]|uniref:Conjugal transfer protein n=1 Tax=Cohnella zeiphila TaxID=2761120 RepID=A0A7X0VW40_9BACL|nr:conjugal transfer protein [Cohnella zeiphila]